MNLALPVGIVVIGRNEGERLVACLASLPDGVPIVYVDSGSTDASVAEAEAVGAGVVALDMSRPFSAARARNEGFAHLLALAPGTEAVQFLDGDTVLRPTWLSAASAFLLANPDVVAVAGLVATEEHPTLADLQAASTLSPDAVEAVVLFLLKYDVVALAPHQAK